MATRQTQALKVFRQELQESTVLRQWWQHGEVATVGPKVEDSLAKFYQLSQYLGDEVAVSGTMEGREPNLLIVAEIRKPGLKKFLQQMIPELAGKSKSGARVLDPQELAAMESKPAAGELMILVRPDYVVGAPGPGHASKFQCSLGSGQPGVCRFLLPLDTGSNKVMQAASQFWALPTCKRS